MTTWVIDASGKSASTSLPNGGCESRMLSAIPATDSILPAAPIQIAQAKSEAFAAIDAQAGKTRAKYITDVTGQAETYLSKASDAANYKAAGYPFASIANYPMVLAEAKALYGAAPTAAQCQSAADAVIATQAQWMALAAAIEQQRRAGKIAVGVAATVADVTASQLSAISALETL